MTNPEPLGDQTVNFVTVTEGPKDHLGIPTKIRNPTPVPNCLFQPFASRERSGVQERTELTEIVREQFRCTAPASVPITHTMTGNDELEYLGVTYQVVGGSRLNRDLDGNIDHVLVICEREVA